MALSRHGFDSRQLHQFLESKPQKGALGGKVVSPYRSKSLLCGRKKNIKKKPSGFLFKERAIASDGFHSRQLHHVTIRIVIK